MLTLYGIPKSRTFRPLWLLHELGLEFEHVKLDFHGDALDDPAYRALNPNGRIPTLVDDGLVLWESMAINLYLARKYAGGTGLWPDSLAGEALTWQWSFWVMTEVESALLSVLRHRRVLAEEKRDPDKASRCLETLKAPFAVLDQALAEREYLLGKTFGVVDLNVAAVMSWCRPAGIALQDYPHLDAWLTRCLDRPARKLAQRT